MARFRMVLTADGVQVRVSYGWSAFLGFFICIRKGGIRVAEVDLLSPGYRGLPGLLDALVDARVFTREVVEAALEGLLVVDDPANIPDHAVRAVATIAFNVKTAAGE